MVSRCDVRLSGFLCCTNEIIALGRFGLFSQKNLLVLDSETGLVPEEILWRPKEAFSDGVSSQKKSWFETLQQHAAEQVSETQIFYHPSTLEQRDA